MRAFSSPRRIGAVILSAAVPILGARQALAHASEQGLVLLLPTDVYIASGAAAVALTVLLMAVLPERVLRVIFAAIRLVVLPKSRLPLVTSTLSALIFLALVVGGLTGPRDPMENPLTLAVWTVFWICVLAVQGLVFDIWRWISPWRGPAALIMRATGGRPLLRLSPRLGAAPAILTFLGVALFLMADPAPADPARLAVVAGGYWLATLVAIGLFGPRWLLRGEGLSVLLRCYGRMSLLARRGGRLHLGLWGWQVLKTRAPQGGLALFMLAILGSGSFDGVNETFWWLQVLGINPLEFPGRSAVVWQNTLGLLAANALLVAVFALTLKLGLMLNRSDLGLGQAVRVFAPTVLPIALGYHIAHYYTALLVDGQYVLELLRDWAGALSHGLEHGLSHDHQGHVEPLAHLSVTTGFFNAPDTMRAIWLTQAGAVVLGHVVAVMLAHAVALRVFGTNRRALLSQAPLALFMIGYTFFGLWLLASPRGV
ncbi:hypothetical protein [Pseudodonghicola flavimaris]|uniref:Fenitrothion hydrolase n=1 Tax=Pseudodonghicola flavimaris TaxID=3050036 RepID=A0ABT7F293_9RHOB|nr:hypothetical protein [Pseudodonghicola flavimaris]MDK3018718.1 hypothetical protein [Pseudodonghicola flavimaris]